MALLKDLTVLGSTRLISDTFGSDIYADKHITNGGLASQFVKGDGTLDSTVYVKTADLSSILTSVTGGVLSSSGNALSLTALTVSAGGTSKSNSASTSIPIINSLSVSTASSAAATNLTLGITVNGKASANATITDLYASYIQTSTGSTNADQYLTFVATAASTGQSLLTDTDLKYNPSTNTLTGTNATFGGILNIPAHAPGSGSGTTSFWIGDGVWSAEPGGGGGSIGETLTITKGGSSWISYNGTSAVTKDLTLSLADITGTTEIRKIETLAASGGGFLKRNSSTGAWSWDTSTYLTSHQTIKQNGITGATRNSYGACATAAATAAKTASVTSGTPTLEAGLKVSIKFTYANTANSPTLNINSTGAKNIFHKGAQITSGANKALLAGVCDFIYDGTRWHLVGNYIDTDTHNSHGHTFTSSAATGAAMSFGGTFTAVTALGNASATTGNLSSTYTTTTYTLPSLPTASASTPGVIKVGTGLSITDGVLSVAGGGVSVDWADISNKPSFVNVVNPSTDNAIVRFDGTTGAIQNSVVTIADTTGNMHFGGSASNRLISYVGADATYYPLYFNTNGNIWMGAGLASNGQITSAKTTNINGHYIYFTFDKTTNVSGGQTSIRMYINSMVPSDDDSISLGGAANRWKVIHAMDGYFTNQLHKYVNSSTTYDYTLPNASGTLALTSDIPTVNDATYSIKTLVGSTTTTVSDFTANQSTNDDITFVAGANITLTPNATTKTITIASTGGSSGTVSSISLNGQNYTASGGQIDLGMSSYNEVIIGTHTAATAAWTGVSRLPSASYFVSGYRFTYWCPYNGVSGGEDTLTLTFQDNSTKTVNLYYKGTTRLTTHFGAGAKIDFIYLENAMVGSTAYTGCWPDADYDANTVIAYGLLDYCGRWRLYNSSNPLYRYKICGYRDNRIVPIVITNQTSNTQVNKVPTAVALDVSMGLVYYGTTTNITATGYALAAQSIIWSVYATTAHYTFNETVPVFSDIYLQGSYDGYRYFTLDRTATSGNYRSYYVFADKGADNAAAGSETYVDYCANFTKGKYYWFVGSSYSTANYFQLSYANPIYYFDGEELIQVTPSWNSMQNGAIYPQFATGERKTLTNDNIILGDSTFARPGQVAISTGAAVNGDASDSGHNTKIPHVIWHNYIRYAGNITSDAALKTAITENVKSYKMWDAGTFNPKHYLNRTGGSRQPMNGSIWFNVKPKGSETSRTESIFFYNVDSDWTLPAIRMSSAGTLTLGALDSTIGITTGSPSSIATVLQGNQIFINAGTEDTSTAKVISSNAWRFDNRDYPSLSFRKLNSTDYIQVLNRSASGGLNIGYDILSEAFTETAVMGDSAGIITGGSGIYLEDTTYINGDVVPEDSYMFGTPSTRWNDIWVHKVSVSKGTYYFNSTNSTVNVRAVVHPFSATIANTAVPKTFAIKIPNIAIQTVYKFTLYCPFNGIIGTYTVGYRTLNASGVVTDRAWVATTGNVSTRAAVARDSSGNIYILLGDVTQTQKYQSGLISVDEVLFISLTAAQYTTLYNHTFTLTELTVDESTMTNKVECSVATS